MLRLYCASAAAMNTVDAAGSGSAGSGKDKDDYPVDVVTLGVLQPPLAGQGSNTVGKRRVHDVVDVHAQEENPGDTLERLLHRTLDSALQSTLEQEPEEDQAIEMVEVNVGDGKMEDYGDSAATGDSEQPAEIPGRQHRVGAHDNDTRRDVKSEPGGLDKREDFDVTLKEEDRGQEELEISTAKESRQHEETVTGCGGDDDDPCSGLVVGAAVDDGEVSAPTPNIVNAIPTDDYALDSSSKPPPLERKADVGGNDRAASGEDRAALSIPVPATETKVTPQITTAADDVSPASDEVSGLEAGDGRGVGSAGATSADPTSFPGSLFLPGGGGETIVKENVPDNDSGLSAIEPIATSAEPQTTSPVGVFGIGQLAGIADGSAGGQVGAMKEALKERSNWVQDEHAIVPEGVKTDEQSPAASGGDDSADAEGSGVFQVAKEGSPGSSISMFGSGVSEIFTEIVLQQSPSTSASRPPMDVPRAEPQDTLTDIPTPAEGADTVIASPYVDTANTAAFGFWPDELGSSSSQTTEDTGRQGGETRGPRKLPFFGKPARSGGIEGMEKTDKNPSKLNLPLDDPASWTMPPFPEIGDNIFPLDGRTETGETTRAAVAGTERPPIWKEWGQVCAAEVKARVGQWAKVVWGKGASWSRHVLKLCQAKAEEVWRDHLRQPVEHERQRWDRAWRFVVAEIAEYLADPVLADLL